MAYKSANPTNDPKVEIDFDQFTLALKKFVRPPEKKKKYHDEGKHAEELKIFYDCIEDSLAEMHVDLPQDERSLRSKQTHGHWRKNGVPSSLSRSIWFVRAIWQLMRIDVSKDRVMTGQPHDFTELVTLDPVTISENPISNKPDDQGNELYRVILNRTRFDAGEQEVRLSWLANLDGHDEPIGTIVYVAREVSLSVKGSSGGLVRPIDYISPTTSKDSSVANDCILRWEDDDWSIRASPAGELLGSLENVYLCDVRGQPSQEIEIQIKMTPDQLHQDFHFKASPNKKAVSPNDREKIEAKLIELLLYEESMSAAVVSLHKILLSGRDGEPS